MTQPLRRRASGSCPTGPILIILLIRRLIPYGPVAETTHSAGISHLPNPANQGQAVNFAGSGTDTDGSITAYQWSSNINGVLSTSRSFSTSSLAVGSHTITFRVQDNQGAWSAPTIQILTIGNLPATPVFPGKNWQMATPESQGVNPTVLNSALNYFHSNSSGTGSDEMVIVRNGYIIWEGVSSDVIPSIRGQSPLRPPLWGF